MYSTSSNKHHTAKTTTAVIKLLQSADRKSISRMCVSSDVRRGKRKTRQNHTITCYALSLYALSLQLIQSLTIARRLYLSRFFPESSSWLVVWAVREQTRVILYRECLHYLNVSTIPAHIHTFTVFDFDSLVLAFERAKHTDIFSTATTVTTFPVVSIVLAWKRISKWRPVAAK